MYCKWKKTIIYYKDTMKIVWIYKRMRRRVIYLNVINHKLILNYIFARISIRRPSQNIVVYNYVSTYFSNRSIFCIVSKCIQMISIRIWISSWLKHMVTYVNFQYFRTCYWSFDTFNIFWYLSFSLFHLLYT